MKNWPRPFCRAFALALVFAGDPSAAGAAPWLHRRRLRDPDAVWRAGFDDTAPARFSTPPRTTVCHSVLPRE